MSASRHHRRRKHAGHTMLELVVAGMLLAATLVPALGMMRDGMIVSGQIEKRCLITTYCVSKLDEHLALAAAYWSNGTVTGDFAAEGQPQLRFSVATSDAVAAGGLVDRLMAVTSTVWQDTNANSVHDSGEPYVTLASKTAKMAVYQDDEVTP